MAAEENITCELPLGKLHRAILPIACFMVGFCYLDRSNIAYMQLQLQLPRPVGLGFSHTLYGNASGLFFVGYAAFQIPSTLVLVSSRGGLFASCRLGD
jgi:MFS transporter, ACS family, tartrate transporter